MENRETNIDIHIFPIWYKKAFHEAENGLKVCADMLSALSECLKDTGGGV